MFILSKYLQYHTDNLRLSNVAWETLFSDMVIHSPGDKPFSYGNRSLKFGAEM